MDTPDQPRLADAQPATGAGSAHEPSPTFHTTWPWQPFGFARARKATFAAVLSILIAGCAITGTDSNTRPTSTPSETQIVVIDEIIDGDTIRLHAASARGNNGPVTARQTTKVRLLEIDAPETTKPDQPGECFANESTLALTDLLPPGSPAHVATDREHQDRYGRLLLYVWNEDGVFVNLRMIEDGYAQSVLFGPNDAYIDQMRSAETQAKNDNRGQWASCRR